MSGADLGGGHEVELQTVNGRGDRLTSFSAAVGAADEVSDRLTSLGVAVEANDDVRSRSMIAVCQEDWSRCLTPAVAQHCLREVPVALEHGFV